MSGSKSRRVVLITGAGGALGSELALASARAGWEPVLLDRTARQLEPVYDRIVAATRTEPIMQPMDLAALGPEQCVAIVEAVKSGPGRLDALVHCAASFEGLQPINQIEPRSWLYDFQVNVHAPWLLTVHCLELLRQAPAARLIFITEDLQKVAGGNWGAYGASKWALDAVAAQFAGELRRSTVSVLAVNPSPMRSSLRAKAYHSESPDDVRPASLAAAKILDYMEAPRQSDTHRVNLFD